jgi:peptide-methionine (S)-S-oxide reductase
LNDGSSSGVATLAGGCFWCIEAIFLEVEGVSAVISGYTGGTTANPTYEEVCAGDTGHAEAVQVTFNPARLSYRAILEVFFSVHDPTTLNRQGPDSGTQYRSAIFYHDERQRAIANSLIRDLNESHVWTEPIATDVIPLDRFYPAEDYHHEYFSQHPEQAYCQMVVSPKLNKFRKQWARRLKGRFAK